MRGTIVRIGTSGAGALLALGLLAGTAGASGSPKEGKAERSGKVTCFQPEGKTQGRSLSNPDGGEADKPGCSGGIDADKDGNNGCGNDTDREDDNNGNCTKLETEAGNAGGEQANGNDTTVKPEEVEGDVTVSAAGSSRLSAGVPAETSTTTTTTTTPGTQVLGEQLSRPDTLARTGAGVGGLALLGGLLLGGGRLTVLARKLLRIG
jgi:hypothetical protein